jgi:lycopene elongase/hydratase (dihydrobisanhydrobacterioruberin-forming)
MGWVVFPLVFLAALFYSGASLNWLSLVQLILLTFPACVFVYGTNDIYDIASDRLNPRKGADRHRLTANDVEWIRTLSGVFVVLLGASSILTGSLTNVAGGMIFIFSFYYYSAPPLRLKCRPPLDSIANATGYGLGPELLGWSFGDTLWHLPSGTIALMCCITAVHALSTIMDHRYDAQVGERTISVSLGKRNAAILSLLLFVIAFLTILHEPIMKWYLGYCVVLAAFAVLRPSEERAINIFGLMFIGFIVSATAFVISVCWR